MHVLVTCGATRNPVDAIRYLSAHSTGRTGLGLARRWAAHGHEVHVLGSAEACLRGTDLDCEEYGSTRDLMARMQRWIEAHPEGAVVHSAAVGDYEVTDGQDHKLPSKQSELMLRLTPTPKIADQVRPWGCSGPYVTFKAAGPDTSDADLIRIASAQRERTGCDWVFANVIGRLGARVALVGATPHWFAARDEALDALYARLASASA